MGQFRRSIGIGDGDGGGSLAPRGEVGGSSMVMGRVGLSRDGGEGELLLPMGSDGAAVGGGMGRGGLLMVRRGRVGVVGVVVLQRRRLIVRRERILVRGMGVGGRGGLLRARVREGVVLRVVLLLLLLLLLCGREEKSRDQRGKDEGRTAEGRGGRGSVRGGAGWALGRSAGAAGAWR